MYFMSIKQNVEKFLFIKLFFSFPGKIKVCMAHGYQIKVIILIFGPYLIFNGLSSFSLRKKTKRQRLGLGKRPYLQRELIYNDIWTSVGLFVPMNQLFIFLMLVSSKFWHYPCWDLIIQWMSCPGHLVSLTTTYSHGKCILQNVVLLIWACQTYGKNNLCPSGGLSAYLPYKSMGGTCVSIPFSLVPIYSSFTTARRYLVWVVFVSR